MKTARAPALLLALILLLSSCGIITINHPGKDSAPETTPPQITSEAVTTAVVTADKPSGGQVKPVETPDYRSISDKYLANLPSGDFGGVGLLIASSDASTFVPSDNKNSVYNARIERNQRVEAKYNTIIMANQTDIDTLYNEAYTAYESGDYYADLLGIPLTAIGRFHAKGLLANMLSLPFTDYTAPYYDGEAMNQLTAGHAVYGAVGELNKNIDYYYGVYFNKELIKQLGLEDPYELVYQDKWDWDAFRTLAVAASAIDGGGYAGHGASVSLDEYIDLLFTSTGEKLTECAWGSVPALAYDTAGTADAVWLIGTLTGSQRSANDGSVFGGLNALGGAVSGGQYSPDKAASAFYDGKLLFYIDRLYYTSWIPDMRDAWGLVPLPKLDNRRGYVTPVYGDMPIVCVLKGSANIENTGLLLQALNAASYGVISDYYYENMLLNIVRDSDTLNMLDRITGRADSVIGISFAQAFGGQYSYIADATYNSVRTAVKTGRSIGDLFASFNTATATRLKRDFPMM